MNICVVALGKVGLPLAVQFAQRGHAVIGIDVDQRTVDLVNRGQEPFPGEADLAGTLQHVVTSGRLRASVDTAAAVASSDVVVVVVPVLVDAHGHPDFTSMDAATQAIGRGLQPGALVCYETTVPVGTTRTRFGPMLEAASGLTAGVDFHLVYSPERVLAGRVFADLRRYPKLVGGIDPSSEHRGMEFYSAVLDFDERPDLAQPNGVWPMGTAEAAEMAKLVETTYRDVNIGLANQFAKYADKVGVDVYRVIEACNSQPYSHIHQPGIAVGGHCIPIYPRLYLSNDPEATIVAAAREANESMPEYAVQRLAEVLGDLKGTTVAVLGATYRGGVKETAFSGVFPVVQALHSRGAIVRVHDPMFSDEELRELGWQAYHLGDPADALILQADHAEYRTLDVEQIPGLKAVLDGRHVLPADGRLLHIGDGSDSPSRTLS